MSWEGTVFEPAVVVGVEAAAAEAAETTDYWIEEARTTRMAV